jgi:2Fe-2S ferredoxin
MGTVTFVAHDGTEHEVELAEGESLMSLAVENLVPGIDGDCGGEAACGTCHVIVDDAWVDTTGTRSDEEDMMLQMSPELEENSRLGCQIEARDELDGLKVHLPEYQV